MALTPVSKSRRRASALGVGLAMMTMAACGGSLVEPKDFVGVGGPNTATTGIPGVTPTDAGAPGVVSPTGGASVPGQGTPGGVNNPSGPTGSGGNVANPLPPGTKAASCAGFKNGPGITDKEITLATIADRSGAVADTFKSAHDAMNAYVAYFNSVSSICGRKLKLQTYDSGLTATGSNEASKSACTGAFALVGSFSAFDSGGADVTAKCGQPDVRASAVERPRQDAATTIQVLPLDTDHLFLQPWIWAKQKFGGSIKKAAFVYLNAGASGTISNAIMKGTAAKLGYKWEKTIVVDIAGVPNWNAYANQLKSAGIELVQTNLADFTSKLRAAFNQANYKPVFMADASFYGPRYIQGDAAQTMEGAYSFTQTALLEEANRNPELQLMQAWLQRTGGDAGNITAMQAWGAGRLFTTTALQLGGKLTRPSLLSALRKVHKFNGNGVLTPTDPGAGKSGACSSAVQVRGGKFVRVSPYPYTCGPLA